MKKIIFILSLAFSINSFAENNYQWEGGECNEYNAGGRYLGTVADNLCYGENYYQWANGYCFEYNAGHRYLGSAEDSYCN